MSQDIFDSIDPAISGTALATALNNFKAAIVSGLSGTTRPVELEPGGYWVDTTNDPTTWSFRLWTGTDDVEVFKIDLSTGAAAVSLAVDDFTVQKVSADSVAAILELVKRRVATGGQVLSGDVVGEIRMVGRDDTAADVVVAKMVFTAGENMTATTFGGTLSFYSTPAGTATLVEHMKFLDGIVEMVKPLKVNAEILVSQNVATTATIAQLSGDKAVVEMTGSTATDIQGINSAHASKVVTIHNRSTANVTLKHQDASAAAADRMKLPGDLDIILEPEMSTTLIYSSADSRWKAQYTSSKFGGFTKTEMLYSGTYTPSVTKLRIGTKKIPLRYTQIGGYSFSTNGTRSASYALTEGGDLYMWGVNSSLQLGVGDTTTRSSPTAVLGGLKFVEVASQSGSSFGISTTGDLYAWGAGTSGALGVGDIFARSSPTLVLGGLKFSKVFAGGGTWFAGTNQAWQSTMGITVSGDLYAWGSNNHGCLEDGGILPKSSPVLVLGGIKFKSVGMSLLASSNISSYGISQSGALYTWGYNGTGILGTGDTNSRSSPVAVLSGIKIVSATYCTSIHAFYALSSNGTLYACGGNAYGQLGVGDVTARSSPVAVMGGVKQIAAGYYSVYALTEDGDIYAWGYNDGGSLGIGDIISRSSPVLVVGGIKYKQIVASGNTAYGLSKDGDLYAWGSDQTTQLGIGGGVGMVSSPVLVVGGIKFKRVFYCQEYSISAEASDGSIYAWGRNNFQQLGVGGDTNSRSTPTLVVGGLTLPRESPQTSLDVTVTAGVGVTVTLGPGDCYFGSTYLGKDIESIDISYAP